MSATRHPRALARTAPQLPQPLLSDAARLEQPPRASPLPARLRSDSLFLFNHFATSLPVVPGRSLRNPGRLLRKWPCRGAGQGLLARKCEPRVISWKSFQLRIWRVRVGTSCAAGRAALAQGHGSSVEPGV